MAPGEPHINAGRWIWLSWSMLASVAIVAAIVAFVASRVNWQFVSGLDFSALWVYRYALWQGLVNTLILVGFAVSIGMVLGTLLAIGMQQHFSTIRWLIVGYVELFRNTPLVVQLFWIHFGLPRLTGVSTSAFSTGFIAITLQSSAYLADVARAGIEAVPKGQWEAADALGLPGRAKWREVVLPQALRIIVPPLANVSVGYFKASAALALLSVGELTTVASRVAQHSFRPIETFTVVGLIYLALGYMLSTLTFRLEKMFGGGR
jgi:polar amino acid transport system permease protein